MAHPFRVVIRNELRKENPRTILGLRRRVSAAYEEIGTRNIQFHLFRMQMAGVVEAFKRDGRDGVRLLKDVSAGLRPHK